MLKRSGCVRSNESLPASTCSSVLFGRVAVTAFALVVFAAACGTESERSGLGSPVSGPVASIGQGASDLATDAVPDYLGQDVATVAGVARVVLSDWETVEEFPQNAEPDAPCGYASVNATADVLEVFKGPLVVGQQVTINWVIECPFDASTLFPGEQIVFVDPGERSNGQVAPWLSLENATLRATAPVLAKLREITASK
jgi:hypothetical protein